MNNFFFAVVMLLPLIIPVILLGGFVFALFFCLKYKKYIMLTVISVLFAFCSFVFGPLLIEAILTRSL
jgi:hypothetical protein